MESVVDVTGFLTKESVFDGHYEPFCRLGLAELQGQLLCHVLDVFKALKLRNFWIRKKIQAETIIDRRLMIKYAFFLRMLNAFEQYSWNLMKSLESGPPITYRN